jgi:hypothetical protein
MWQILVLASLALLLVIYFLFKKKTTIKIVGINVHPIKGCKAMSVNEWPISETGLLHDRK